MGAEKSGNNVRANCPDCGGAWTTFEFNGGGREFGYITREGVVTRTPSGTATYLYRLLRCAGCGRGGMSALEGDRVLVEFYPPSIQRASLPPSCPDQVTKDYREAEMCASVSAYRAASAMLRSALEKVFKENGFKERDLHKIIEAAQKEGLITAALESKAKTQVKNLGNDILHDPWFEVTPEDYSSSHGYVLRIIESFYDDRPTVETLLRARGRLP